MTSIKTTQSKVNVKLSDLMVLPVLSLFVVGFLTAAYFSLDVFSTGYSLNFSSELLGSILLGFFSMIAGVLICASLSKKSRTENELVAKA